MRFGGRRTSSNIERQTGGGRGGGLGFPGLGGGGGSGGGGMPFPMPVGGRGGLGCGTIAMIIIIFVALQYCSSGGLGGLGGLGLDGGAPVETSQGDSAIRDDTDRFVAQVLASTEDRWTELFRERGQQYRPATLVFYDRNGRSGCGAAQSAMGPFYCPADQRIYLDTTFFEELGRNFGAPGDFAQAYVIAHEVGHHIQTLMGRNEQVRNAQARASQEEGNALQVRMELEADCFAGVWAHHERDIMEPGDIEEGMRAAQAIGDDTLQRAAQGYVVPESFTHGSAEQRQRWLRRGLESGDPEQCDTFRAGAL